MYAGLLWVLQMSKKKPGVCCTPVRRGGGNVALKVSDFTSISISRDY
jgi:hypothetical protein